MNCVVRQNINVLKSPDGRDRMNFNCCPRRGSFNFIVTRAKQHLLDCGYSKQKNPTAYEHLVRAKYGDGIADNLRERRQARIFHQSEFVRAQPANSHARDVAVPVSMVSKKDAQSSILKHVAVTSQGRKERLDELYSHGFIVDGLPFSHGNLSGFQRF